MESPSAGAGAELPEMPEPDLAGIPDVVAEVNGEAIPKDEFVAAYERQFQRLALQSQMSGQEVDQDQLKDQVAENLIGTELLIQEAEKRGIEASEEDIAAAMNELVETNQLPSADEFISAMEERGMSEEEVNEQLAIQVKVDQFLAEETGDLSVTDEELNAAYEQLKAQQEQMGAAGGQELPPLEDIEADLEEQVLGQKEAEAAQALIADLRNNADVTINL